MKKKFISLLCIIALFSTTLTGSFGAVYAETASPVKEVAISETMPVEISLTQEASAPVFFSEIAPYQGSYFSQLSDAQKSYYVMMEGAYLTNDMPDGRIDQFVQKLEANTYPVKVDTTSQALMPESAALVESIYQDIAYAYFAFVYDHPQLFWASGIEYGVRYAFYTNGEGYLTEINFAPKLSYAGAADLTSQFVMGIDQAVQEIENRRANDSAYETTKEIHDYLCNKVTYNQEAADASADSLDDLPDIYKAAHSAGPVFTEDTPSVVCEGYGKAFKILCDAFEIPCVMIVGDGNAEAHLWNYVQIDGLWYAVDVTWDD